MLAAVFLCAGLVLGIGGSLAGQPRPPVATVTAPAASRTLVGPAGVAGHDAGRLAIERGSELAARPERLRRRSLTVAVTGDLLPHSPVVAQARANAQGTRAEYDFRPMLAPVRPLLRSADLALCHLEVPLASDNSDLSSYPVFNAPRELGAALADAGYDGCSTASNHSYDQGSEGVRNTLAVLDEAGVGHTGTARSREEARRQRLYEVNGVTIAHLSYATWLNGFTLPADRPWLVAQAEVARIRADARRARHAGAEFVIVSLHWGAEYVAEPTAEQRQLAERLAASQLIDLLVGHHAHVVQAVERVRGKLVIFGLGNFLSNQSAACCPVATQDGVIVQLTIKEQPRRGAFRVTRVRSVPTFVDRPGYRILAVHRALRDGGTDPALLPLLQASLQRTTDAVGTVSEVAR